MDVPLGTSTPRSPEVLASQVAKLRQEFPLLNSLQVTRNPEGDQEGKLKFTIAIPSDAGAVLAVRSIISAAFSKPGFERIQTEEISYDVEFLAPQDLFESCEASELELSIAALNQQAQALAESQALGAYERILALVQPAMEAAVIRTGAPALLGDVTIFAQNGEYRARGQAAFLNEAQRQAIKKAHPSWQVHSIPPRVSPDQKVDSLIVFPISSLAQ